MDNEYLERLEDERQVQGHPCCSNCKYCICDWSTNTIECGLPYDLEKKAEWVRQESEAYFNPSNDYCTEWRSDITGNKLGVSV